MCLISDAETCVVLTVVSKRARKDHKCKECFRVISKGERYLYESYVFEGIKTHKTCSHCVNARRLLEAKCGGWVYGGILDDLDEHIYVKEWGFYAARLSIGIRRKWKRFKGDGLMRIVAR